MNSKPVCVLGFSSDHPAGTAERLEGKGQRTWRMSKSRFPWIPWAKEQHISKQINVTLLLSRVLNNTGVSRWSLGSGTLLGLAAEWCSPWGRLQSGCFSETLSWNLLHGGSLASRLLSTRHNSLKNAGQDQALSSSLILSYRSQRGKSILSCCLILFMGCKQSA